MGNKELRIHAEKFWPEFKISVWICEDEWEEAHRYSGNPCIDRHQVCLFGSEFMFEVRL